MDEVNTKVESVFVSRDGMEKNANCLLMNVRFQIVMQMANACEEIGKLKLICDKSQRYNRNK